LRPMPGNPEQPGNAKSNPNDREPR
jgi:hypothetical protein